MTQNSVNFTVEFHDELEGGIPEPIVDQVYDGLNRVARGVNDISHAMVNVKIPAQNRATNYVYEVTIRLWMDGNDATVTEKGEMLDGTLGAALDALERNVKEVRERKRGQ
ncbi:MAG: hypothetical protein IPK19_19465 [Chloroflexi bacterium]|nr:hypothetical protein [Chloroflexota bacterium]